MIYACSGVIEQITPKFGDGLAFENAVGNIGTGTIANVLGHVSPYCIATWAIARLWQDPGYGKIMTYLNMKFIRFEYRQEKHVGVLTDQGIAPVQAINPRVPDNLLELI